jgi:hypothetical protein
MNQALYQAILAYAKAGNIKCVPKAGGCIKHLVLTPDARAGLHRLGLAAVDLIDPLKDDSLNYNGFSAVLDYKTVKPELGSDENEQALRTQIAVLPNDLLRGKASLAVR